MFKLHGVNETGKIVLQIDNQARLDGVFLCELKVFGHPILIWPQKRPISFQTLFSRYAIMRKQLVNSQRPTQYWADRLEIKLFP